MRSKSLLVATLVALCLVLVSASYPQEKQDETLESEVFLSLLIGPESERRAAVERIGREWRPGYAVRILETLAFQRNRDIYTRLVVVLEDKTGRRFGTDTQKWYQWIWSQPPATEPRYAQFKSDLYRNLDPIFAGYFSDDRESLIRLDEVRWGGVKQDGIPPLREPKMISAEEADYLDDRDVIFGIEVNGDARAYPKRILAWHEMFTDTVGGVPVAGVYCTLCGTVILFETNQDDVQYQLGTSGFLYRSNKLMYDRTTQSLWSTFRGEPVIGPLVGKGIVLQPRAIVTSRWGAWRERHPDTKVLSLDTGHERDYSEGAAYREYFATDELMFNVPTLDRRLKNKDEVLTMTAAGGHPLAIAARFLEKKTLYHTELGGQPIIVVTDPSGANRVYEAKYGRFESWDGDRTLVDRAGDTWTLDEAALHAEDGRTLQRLPAQRAFWFGWQAVYPDTRLIK